MVSTITKKMPDGGKVTYPDISEMLKKANIKKVNASNIKKVEQIMKEWAAQLEKTHKEWIAGASHKTLTVEDKPFRTDRLFRGTIPLGKGLLIWCHGYMSNGVLIKSENHNDLRLCKTPGALHEAFRCEACQKAMASGGKKQEGESKRAIVGKEALEENIRIAKKTIETMKKIKLPTSNIEDTLEEFEKQLEELNKNGED